MVGFVLEDDGGEAADGISDRFESIDVNITDDHSLRTLHIPVYVRYGQAAFRTGLRLFRPVYYTDIRIYLERLSSLSNLWTATTLLLRPTCGPAMPTPS